jgi:hypothetical protein
MSKVRYYLTVFEIATDTVVYENGFYTIDGLNDEREYWDSPEYYDEVEALETAE